jgi:hypothetical protein
MANDKKERPSLVMDFASIGKMLRDKEAVEGKKATNPIDCLCLGAGYIGVLHPHGWKGIQCPECKNPARKRNPL